MGKVVVVSPHLDDAVLSCWSVLGPDCDVVTVFTGGPGRPGFLSDWDRNSGAIDSDTRMIQRIEENRAALEIAGAHAINLGAVETQYGGGAVSAASLRDHLQEAESVFAPAGVGVLHENLEHVRVRDACLLVRPDASFYADQPYCQFQPASQFQPKSPLRAATFAGTISESVTLTSDQRTQKEAALRCYAGEMPQLEWIFHPFLNPERLAHELLWRKA